MIRGTTPTHTFECPIDTAKISEIKITYKQGEEIILIKRTEDCVIDESCIKATLTQEDTFKFHEEKMVKIQLRILTIDGKLLSTHVNRVDVAECLDDEVLV